MQGVVCSRLFWYPIHIIWGFLRAVHSGLSSNYSSFLMIRLYFVHVPDRAVLGTDIHPRSNHPPMTEGNHWINTPGPLICGRDNFEVQILNWLPDPPGSLLLFPQMFCGFISQMILLSNSCFWLCFWCSSKKMDLIICSDLLQVNGKLVQREELYSRRAYFQYVSCVQLYCMISLAKVRPELNIFISFLPSFLCFFISLFLLSISLYFSRVL